MLPGERDRAFSHEWGGISCHHQGNRMELDTRPAWVQAMVDSYEIDRLLLIDGMGQAILGIVARQGQWIAVYDELAIIRELMRINEWDEETAAEYCSYNIVDAWVGDGTPIVMQVHRPEDM